MSDLGDIQRVLGETLIPEARAQQGAILGERDSLTLALELYYTAFSVKTAHQQGALFIAKRFAQRMGLNADHVESFAVSKIAEALDEGDAS